MPDTEQVIDDFFNDDTRANDLRRMRDALADRLAALKARRDASTDDEEKAMLTSKISALTRQTDALRTEEAVSQFVEDSIKVTLAKAEPEDESE